MTNETTEAIWELANTLSSNTNCKKREVGCVIYDIKANSMIAYGYNKHTNGICDCNSTKGTAIHAEASAIGSILGHYDKKDLVAFVNHKPCCDCASKLDAVVSEVRYRSQK